MATNDCRFETREMELPHDVLVCIGEGRKLAEAERRRAEPVRPKRRGQHIAKGPNPLSCKKRKSKGGADAKPKRKRRRRSKAGGDGDSGAATSAGAGNDA